MRHRVSRRELMCLWNSQKIDCKLINIWKFKISFSSNSLVRRRHRKFQLRYEAVIFKILTLNRIQQMFGIWVNKRSHVNLFSMAVLLTYHKLVERDEKTVQMHWKGKNCNSIWCSKNFDFFVKIILHFFCFSL